MEGEWGAGSASLTPAGQRLSNASWLGRAGAGCPLPAEAVAGLGQFSCVIGSSCLEFPRQAGVWSLGQAELLSQLCPNLAGMAQ